MVSKIQQEISKIKEERIKSDIEKYGEDFFRIEKVGYGFTPNNEQKEFIINTYQQKYENAVSVGKRFGKSSTWINARLKKWGVPIKSASDLFKLHTFDENYFESIDSEDKAYWLGFIFADGSVTYNQKSKEGKIRNVLRMSLQYEDIGHLSKFANSIKLESYEPKKFTTTVNGKNYTYTTLSITSEKMVKDVIDKGMIETNNIYKQDKKELIRFPDETKVPKNLLKHFVRGYFDGDGSLTRSRHKGSVIDTNHYTVKIVSNKVFCEELKEFFRLDELHDYKPETKNIYKKSEDSYIYSFESGGNHRVYHIYKIIYDNSNIFLDRKMKRFDEFVNYFKENNYIDGVYSDRPKHHNKRINNKTNKLIFK